MNMALSFAAPPISSVMTPDGEGPLYDGPSNPCEDGPEDDENEEEEENNIEIDASDLKNHPKANCVYQKLSQTNTMEGVVGKFAGEDTDFDLNIEVDRVDGGYGKLLSSPNNNTFTMRIDEEGLLQRKSLETAVTFMHEAIHAEMRRYLHGATDTSTLPGFPGDFHTDWEFFVNEFYDGKVDDADHAAMATKYRNIIVDALKEYDNNELTTEEYEALAWHGLSDTKYYRNVVEPSEKQAIADNRKSALNKTADSCN